jgi:hypothetical protein
MPYYVLERITSISKIAQAPNLYFYHNIWEFISKENFVITMAGPYIDAGINRNLCVQKCDFEMNPRAATRLICDAALKSLYSQSSTMCTTNMTN